MIFSVRSEGKDFPISKIQTEVFVNPNIEFSVDPSENLDFVAQALNELGKLSRQVTVSDEGTGEEFAFILGNITFSLFIGKVTEYVKTIQEKKVIEGSLEIFSQEPALKSLIENFMKEEIFNISTLSLGRNKERAHFFIQRNGFSLWVELVLFKRKVPLE